MITRAEIPAARVHAQLQDPGPGEHLWTTVVAFRVSDDVIRRLQRGEAPDPLLLDHENVLSVGGPGCYKCEEPFSVRLSHRRCKGSMEPLD